MPAATRDPANPLSTIATKRAVQQQELAQTKRLALVLLIVATLLFLTSIILPTFFAYSWHIGLLKTVSEAAMIGALADWFAVRALFKPVPIPIVKNHTNIIPNNKKRIAENLADFVQEKFFHEDALKTLVREHEPASTVSKWLNKDENKHNVIHYTLHFTRHLLSLSDNASIQRWLVNTSHAVLENINLTQSAGSLLAALTAQNKHQTVLNNAIDTTAAYLNTPKSQEVIANSIAEWFKEAYPTTEKLLPVGWISKNGAQVISRAVISTIGDMHANPAHPLRKKFDAVITTLIHDLKHTDKYDALSDSIKDYLKNDAEFSHYLASLWQNAKQWLADDISEDSVAAHSSRIQQNLLSALTWVSETLASDAELRQSINAQIEAAMTPLAPDIAAVITAHMSNTLINWPDEDLVEQIELNIGKDLHYIRINGTVVGAMIGAVLFLVAQIPSLF